MSDIPVSSFPDLLWDSEALLSVVLGVLQEQHGARCKTCDAKSAK